MTPNPTRSSSDRTKIRRPKKSLGQHFLRCAWVAEAMVRSADITPQDAVLEIGPGEGALTRPLARAAGQVIAVEKDERLAQALSAALKKEIITNTKIVFGDILSLLRDALVHDSPYKVVANIPYYLTSRLIRLLLGREARPKTIVLTIQKEVAERIVARPPQMNLLALSVQAFGTPEVIAAVPKTCFLPQPNVDSAILKISNISGDFFTTHALKPEAFFRIVRRPFGQKRKMLCSALAPSIPKPRCQKVLADLGLSPQSRPQELSLQQWATLVVELERVKDLFPP